MMKTSVVTLAALALATSAQAASTYYNPSTAVFPTTGDCEKVDLKTIKNGDADFAVYLEAKTGATPAPDLAKCATQATLVEVSTDVKACIQASDNTIVPGSNGTCPLAKDATCTATQVCTFGTRCTILAPATELKCNTIPNVWTTVIDSSADTFTSNAVTEKATKALTDALETVTECKAPNSAPVAGFVSTKNLKQYTINTSVPKACNDKLTEVQTALKTQLETISKATGATTTYSLKGNIASGPLDDLKDCAIKNSNNEYGCRSASPKDGECKAIKCDFDEQCTEAAQCGTGSCKAKKGADVPTGKFCSGSAISSAVFAVGAAALAAVAFF